MRALAHLCGLHPSCRQPDMGEQSDPHWLWPGQASRSRGDPCLQEHTQHAKDWDHCQCCRGVAYSAL
jgi:hypothetical protein